MFEYADQSGAILKLLRKYEQVAEWSRKIWHGFNVHCACCFSGAVSGGEVGLAQRAPTNSDQPAEAAQWSVINQTEAAFKFSQLLTLSCISI